MKLILILTVVLFNFSKAYAQSCRSQNYIDELDVRHYFDAHFVLGDPQLAGQVVAKMTKFRARHYGRIEDAPTTHAYNNASVSNSIVSDKFFGQEVKLHKKIVPALKCVERAINNECGGDLWYRPAWVSSYRSTATFPAVISNHRFGIALDLEPMPKNVSNGNPCCGPSCAVIWREHQICKNHDTTLDSPLNISRFNDCWVKAFEFYGFHWLVNDRLHDTMHFEFLGDPDLIHSASDDFVYYPSAPLLSWPN